MTSDLFSLQLAHAVQMVLLVALRIATVMANVLVKMATLGMVAASVIQASMMMAQSVFVSPIFWTLCIHHAQHVLALSKILLICMLLVFIACDCCTEGTEGGSESCNSNGQCTCLKGFTGPRCCQCEEGYYRPVGTRECIR